EAAQPRLDDGIRRAAERARRCSAQRRLRGRRGLGGRREQEHDLARHGSILAGSLRPRERHAAPRLRAWPHGRDVLPPHGGPSIRLLGLPCGGHTMPTTVRAYLVVDAYPAARANVTIPPTS